MWWLQAWRRSSSWKQGEQEGQSMAIPWWSLSASINCCYSCKGWQGVPTDPEEQSRLSKERSCRNKVELDEFCSRAASAVLPLGSFLFMRSCCYTSGTFCFPSSLQSFTDPISLLNTVRPRSSCIVRKKKWAQTLYVFKQFLVLL